MDGYNDAVMMDVDAASKDMEIKITEVGRAKMPAHVVHGAFCFSRVCLMLGG